MADKSKSIQAIELARAVLESVHGNLGLLKFNIDELMPKNGNGEDNSEIWEMNCSFYETLGSKNPSKYQLLINLKDQTVTIKKLNGEKTKEKKYTVQVEE